MNYLSIQPLIQHKEISSFTFSELWGIADSHRKVGIEEVYARLIKSKIIIKRQWAFMWMSVAGLFLNLFAYKFLGMIAVAAIGVLLVFRIYIFWVQIKNLKANLRDYNCIICNMFDSRRGH